MTVARERIYDSIRERILAGAYKAGDHLKEAEVARELEVSRTPVREALQRLASDGLVEFEANRGARVVGWSASELDEIYELRALLESHGARLAANSIDQPALKELTRLADMMEELASDREPTDFEAIALLNNEFHRIILSSTGNALLVGVLSSLVHVPQVHRTFQRFNKTQLQRSFAHHRELITALTEGDAAWAESVMRAHILAARVVLSDRDDAE